MNVIKIIQKQIQENPILIYMKGSPDSPSCGFSSRAVEAISSCGIKFAYVNILEHEDIRSELPKYSNWPTFPQLWVHGELIGGCDIILQMLNNGELEKLLQKKKCKK
ncbi:Grx4 family monothiol glutaredoxin [Buchnera aphidicola]|uniref:Grx4 family monothiol glutaredoxin n=1 Tax=Buchnera aphidicola TaxID=9 RepID=UPI003464793F